MNKTLLTGLLLICFGLQFISCNKKDKIPVLSSATFVHASPGTGSFQLFVDTLGPINNTTVAYGGSSGYTGFVPGSRNISLENRTTTPKSVFAQMTEDLEAGKAYTYLIYDTLDAKGGVKVLRLTDVISVPSGSNASVRFLNLAPNGGSMDVTLVRGTQFDSSSSSTQKLVFVAIDSVTISGQNYVGTSPNPAALSEFKTAITGVTGNAVGKGATIAAVPAFNQNNRYIVKLKTAGTQTVLLQSASVTILPGRVYTIFARGTARGQALNVSVVQNF